METHNFNVKGMHCASCSSIITKKIQKLPGVHAISVNFATEKAAIEYDSQKTSVEQMNEEINTLGYSLDLQHSQQIHNPQNNQHEELEQLQERVHFALPITILMFLLMMWDMLASLIPQIPLLPIPMELFNTISFLLSTIILFWIGKPFLQGIKTFIQYGVANMDSLIGIGTVTAYLYSSVIFLIPAIRQLLHVPEYTYFDVTIVVIGFVTLGKYLETRSKLKTGEAIRKLMNLQVKSAWVERNGKEIELPIQEVIVGDILRVKPGTKIPVDGIIIDGLTSIDESMITGESIPVDKKRGDTVIGSTINKQGSIRVQATTVGSKTMLAQIIKLVEDAQGSKANIQKLADSISAIFVPTVLIIAIVSVIVWLTVGTYILGFSLSFSYALLAFVGILVIACPCALGLATPTAIIVGVGKGASNGILIKNAQSLEALHSVNTVVFDKTGTITNGQPIVTDILTLHESLSVEEILNIAASIERHSQHPLAQAIVTKAQEQSLTFHEVTRIKETEGVGVEGTMNKKHIIIRKPTPEEQKRDEITTLQSEGKTVIVIEINLNSVGVIAMSDTIKKDAKDTIVKLQAYGVTPILLTGDNRRAADYIAKQAGIDTVYSEVMPHEKASVIQLLQKKGKIVAMVGDGINDAPSLAQADVGVAMSTGTDIAIESSDITLLNGDIRKLPQAIRLSKITMRTIKQNLFWAFIYNIIGIPLAAGMLYPFWGIFLNPVFAGLAMAISSVSVVSNSLLLKRARLIL